VLATIKRLWRGTGSSQANVRESSFRALNAYAQRNPKFLGPTFQPSELIRLLDESDDSVRQACQELVSTVRLCFG
jgi:hypothetical protein